MINDLFTYINSETIYLVANWGVIPFWLLLIFFPNNSGTHFFAQSIIVPLLLAIAYAYLAYNLYLEENIFDGFELYRGLDGLYSMFSNEILSRSKLAQMPCDSQPGTDVAEQHRTDHQR